MLPRSFTLSAFLDITYLFVVLMIKSCEIFEVYGWIDNHNNMNYKAYIQVHFFFSALEEESNEVRVSSSCFLYS